MKPKITLLLLIPLISLTSFGSILSFIESPQDDIQVLGGCKYPCNYPEIQPDATSYNELIAVRIHSLTQRTNIVACFGPKLDQCPADRSRPLFAPMMLCESGLTPTETPKRHTDYHAIGDVGFLEVHYGWDGEWVAASAIHLRTDNKFVPIKSTNDFSARLEWDRQKFAQLKKYLDEHLSKLTDLGVVEVSETKPTRVSLGASSSCWIKTQNLHHPNVDHIWFEIQITKEAAATNDFGSGVILKSIDRTNQPVGFVIDGAHYKLTPKLVDAAK